MKIVLYTTHCPKCEVLCKKLNAKNIEYTEVTDVKLMKSLGMHSAPGLQVDDNPVMTFGEAIKWVEGINAN